MSANSRDSQAGRGHWPGSRSPLDPAELRRLAEQKVKAQDTEAIANLSREEVCRIVHELRVHQIELKTQNEELRRMREALEASRARYFNLYDLAPVGYFTVSKNGLILEANLTAASQLGVARGALVRQPLSHFVFRDDEDVYYFHHKQLLESGRRFRQPFDVGPLAQGFDQLLRSHLSWAQFDIVLLLYYMSRVHRHLHLRLALSSGLWEYWRNVRAGEWFISESTK